MQPQGRTTDGMGIMTYSTGQSFNIIFNHVESALAALEREDTSSAIRMLKPLLAIAAEQGLILNSADPGCGQWHRFVKVIAEKYPAESEDE